MHQTKKELRATISRMAVMEILYKTKIDISGKLIKDLNSKITSYNEKEPIYKKEVADLKMQLNDLTHQIQRLRVSEINDDKDKKIIKLNQAIDSWTERFNEQVKLKNTPEESFLSITSRCEKKIADLEGENRKMQLAIDELETQVEYKEKQYASLQARFERVLGQQMSDKAEVNKTDVRGIAKGKPLFETLGEILGEAAVKNPVLERQDPPSDIIGFPGDNPIQEKGEKYDYQANDKTTGDAIGEWQGW